MTTALTLLRAAMSIAMLAQAAMATTPTPTATVTPGRFDTESIRRDDLTPIPYPDTGSGCSATPRTHDSGWLLVMSALLVWRCGRGRTGEKRSRVKSVLAAGRSFSGSDGEIAIDEILTANHAPNGRAG